MARPESQALAGFYALPPSQLRRLVRFFAAPSRGTNVLTSQHVTIVDPCAGEGEAIEMIAKGINANVEIFTCESEAERYEKLHQRFGRRSWRWAEHALHGDAFRVSWRGRGAGLLLLNPPYEEGRLELRFLARFTDVLAPDGLLVYVVPHYALRLSAEHLARWFAAVACYRFAGEDFDVFRQIVLFGVRRSAPLLKPDPELLARIERWALDAAVLPELPPETDEIDPGAIYALPTTYNHDGAIESWKIRALDMAALIEQFRPWHETNRRGLVPLSQVLPTVPIVSLLRREYEVAVPPRPAHIAAGLAAGLFNGQQIEPDDPATGLPSLLIKGAYDREWRTVSTKTNKAGEVTGEEQVQAPKLVVTVLDLTTYRYTTVRTSVERTGSTTIAEMTIADLLDRYGASLLDVMRKQCRILYDPTRDADKFPLPPWPRREFAAQQHAVRANLALLRGGWNPAEGPLSPFLDGEVGVGKSTIALITALAYGARRPLVLCPPHLVPESWPDEIRAAWPDARCMALGSISDVDRFAADRDERPLIAILSRETAKLGHEIAAVRATAGRFELRPLPGAPIVRVPPNPEQRAAIVEQRQRLKFTSIPGACPRCGGPLPKEEEILRKRSRCRHAPRTPANRIARLCHELARKLRPHAPRNTYVDMLQETHLDERWLARIRDRTPAPFAGLDDELVDRIVAVMVARLRKSRDDAAMTVLQVLLVAAYDEQRILGLLEEMWDVRPEDTYGSHRRMLLMLLPNSAAKVELATKVRTLESSKSSAYYHDHWKPYVEADTALCTGKEAHAFHTAPALRWQGKVLTTGGAKARTLECALVALEKLYALGTWDTGRPCGEPLYQAVPTPRRYPLATYISRRHKRAFDLLILDEAHEYATEGSAQERAAHRLTNLRLPTIYQTGTAMNGYAESLFTNMWAMSPTLRAEFAYGQRSQFVERYGFRRRLVAAKEGEIKSRGSVTDRVETTERNLGDAPGVLPSLLFRHVLRQLVTVHKADLKMDLPPCTIEPPEKLAPTPEQAARYDVLLRKLLQQIRADRFKKDLAGRLFGMLAELPSYLDRCTDDAGNAEGGRYEVRYPESMGGKVIASVDGFPARTILPKEAWMLRRVEQELRAGRRVMVFPWHVEVLPRLARLIEKNLGEPAPILYASKVSTGKRQSWIREKIIEPKRRVMLANPVAIQTGLNNLVWFSSELWMENPACNPLVYRQAIGREDRIGQTQEVRIAFPIYDGTLQVQLYKLLMDKVAVSVATDGLDPEAALMAAGVAEDAYLTGLSIGKQLYRMYTGETV